MIVWNRERTNELIALWNQGYSCLRIAEEMFLSESYKDVVLGKIKRLKDEGLLPKDRPQPPIMRRLKINPPVPWLRVSNDERVRRLAAVPPDTRSLTGRVCGDPLPGRSALDREGGRRP